MAASAASQTETTVLRLQEDVAGPADKALGALGRLEAQIVREQAALGRLGQSFVQAKAQLSALAEGSADPKAVAAFERQKQAVADLQAKLAGAKDTLAIMSQTRVTEKVMQKGIDSVETLTAKLDEAQEKMAGLEKAANTKMVNLDAYRKQAGAVQSMGDRMAGQKDKIAGLKDKLAEGQAAASAMKPKLDAAGDAMRAMGVAGVDGGSKFGSLLKLFGKMGPMLGIAVVGVIALTAAVAAASAVLYKAISAASELREELLDLRTAGVFWWDAQRANESGAKKLQESIDRVAASSAVARDKIVGYATQLRNSRFQGKQLETALEGMAIAGAAGGEKLASQFLGLAQTARYYGQDLDKLTERFKTKFGAVAEARLRSLSVQFSKFKENITWIFSGADIEPFLKGLQTILSLFNRNTDGAKTMRNMVTKFTEAAIGGFLRVAIFLVKTYIWLRTNAAAWDTIGIILKGVKLLFVTLGVLAAAALGIIALGVAGLIAAVGILGAGLGLIGEALATLWAYWKSHSLSEIGKAMVEGLVNGIKAAGGAVLKALVGVVSSAVKGVKSYLQTGSPSRLMFNEVGYPMGTGAAGGIDKSTAEVSDAARGMVSAGVSSAKAEAASAPAASSSSSSGRVIQFNNCTFGGDTNESTIRKMVHAVFDAESNAFADPT
jgi:uncharacterized coiled-coil protein SlyX